MLKKNRRDVRFIKITLQSKTKNSSEELQDLPAEINGHSPLRVCLSQLYTQINNTEKPLSYPRNNGKLNRALRCISFDDNDFVTLLWGIGDKDTVNPCFWNDTTDSAREEQAKDGEKVACSGHVIISLQYMPQIAGYMACLEEVPNLSSTSLAEALNHLFNRYVHIFREDESDSNAPLQQTVRVNIETLASRSFDEAMMGGRCPIEIIAETTILGENFDENFSRSEKSLVRLKAKPDTLLEVFKQKFTAFRRANRGYQKYSIKYREADKTERTLVAENGFGDADSLDSYLFIHRDIISLDEEIKQFCPTIHSELEQKMKTLVSVEQRYLYQRTQSD